MYSTNYEESLMSNEHSKAIKRRFNLGAFHNRYYVGNGIDIGGGNDALDKFIHVFPLLKSVYVWDKKDGDAVDMASIPDNHYDFVVSSHCLEHLSDPYKALDNWIRIVKPGGYIIVTVPDEDLYEMGKFPSTFNPEHAWTFTIYKESDQKWSPVTINILDMLSYFANKIIIEKIELINDFYNTELAKIRRDQTQLTNVEACIEFILKKR